VHKSVDEIEKYVFAPSIYSSNIDLACRLFQKITLFLKELIEENLWQRLARQDHNKSQVDEYGRLLDEAISNFSVRVFLNTTLPSVLNIRYQDEPGIERSSFTCGIR
jgi:hypothetical protein